MLEHLYGCRCASLPLKDHCDEWKDDLLRFPRCLSSYRRVVASVLAFGQTRYRDWCVRIHGRVRLFLGTMHHSVRMPEWTHLTISC